MKILVLFGSVWLLSLWCIGVIGIVDHPSNPSLTRHASRTQQRRTLEQATSWYTRYPAYPPYCSTPDEMKTRSIPALLSLSKATAASGTATRLRHVTVVARHGARTPSSAAMNCWEGYSTNPETAIWNCSSNTYLATPPPSEIAKFKGERRSRRAMASNALEESNGMFLFDKRYDALQTPLSNYFGGTCELGQLLLQGYEQELTNGQILRDTYVSNPNGDHDPRMQLIHVAPNSYQDEDQRPVWDRIHYRADDMMRTMMSGQVMLRGLLDPELQAYVSKHHTYPVFPMYTADLDRDILGANEQLYPRLTEIRERITASQEHQALNQSTEATLLRKFQREVLKVPNQNADMSAIDCSMTTICTDRPLPDAVNDYRVPSSTNPVPLQENATEWSNEYGTNLLQRLYEFNAQLWVSISTASEAEYSKLAMSFLWKEIMTKINEHRHNSSSSSTTSSTLPKRLTLISGHDSTIIPLMATLGVWNDSTWPTYACMMIIELHELDVVESGTTLTSTRNRSIYPSNYAFRLLYNGAVLTSQIKGCPNDLDLCDIAVLDGHLVVNSDCKRNESDTSGSSVQDGDSIIREVLSTPQGILSLLGLMSFGALVGAVTVVVCLRGSCFGSGVNSRESAPFEHSAQIGYASTAPDERRLT